MKEKHGVIQLIFHLKLVQKILIVLQLAQGMEYVQVMVYL